MSVKHIAEILFLPSLLVAGIIIGFSGIVPQWLTDGGLSSVLLGLLVFQVGLGLGSRRDFTEILRTVSFKTLLLPLFTITGTLIATAVGTGGVGVLLLHLEERSWHIGYISCRNKFDGCVPSVHIVGP